MSLIIILTAGHTDLVLLPAGDLGPGAAPSCAMVSSSVSDVVAVDELEGAGKEILVASFSMKLGYGLCVECMCMLQRKQRDEMVQFVAITCSFITLSDTGW